MYKNKSMHLLFDKIIKLPIGVKTALFLALASFITKGLNIITTPIYTRLLTTTEIGEVVIFSSWNNIFAIVVGLGLSMGSFNIAMMEFENKRDEYISSILKLSTISALITLILFIIFERFIIQLTGLPKNLMFLMLIGFVFNPAMDFWLLKKRYEYDYKKIAVITLSSSVVGAIIGIIAVMLAHKQTVYSLAAVRLWATSAVPLLVSITLYFSQINKGGKFVDMKYWSYSLKLSIPLIFHAIGKQILDVSDRIMIQKFEGMVEVGIYGIIYTISSISLIFWNAINASLIPFMFDKISKGKEEEKKIIPLINLLLVMYAFLCVFLALLAPEILRIIATKEYYNGIYLVPPVAAGIFFTSLYNLYSNVLLFYKKTKLVMIATLIAAITNISLNFIFIPRYGYIAAAYTTLFSFIILAFIQYAFMKHLRKGDGLFNNKFIWTIGLMVTISTLICKILYGYTIIRYLLLLIIILIAILKRKTIINAIKTIKTK